MIRVKICCISTVAEANLAVKYGASALGLVSEMPSGPGVIDEETIADIACIVPPAVSTFLLTSKQNSREIIEQHRKCGTSTIQLCDRVAAESHIQLKASLPGIKIVQVIHVAGEESVNEAVEISSRVDAILLDSGNQLVQIKELGGTGRTHDWGISKKIVDAVNCPVFLAGGLNPENVAEAIAKVQPFGVDICSGVRSHGKLDEPKLRRFFESINSTYR